MLELRDNTGEDARRTHNLNLANWVSDECIRRVEADEVWSLMAQTGNGWITFRVSGSIGFDEDF